MESVLYSCHGSKAKGIGVCCMEMENDACMGMGIDDDNTEKDSGGSYHAYSRPCI